MLLAMIRGCSAIVVVLLSVVCVTSMAAPQKSSLNFEVASVKPATAPPGVTVSGNTVMAPRREDMRALRESGGPGTNDPGRIHYPLVSLKGLLLRAYDSFYEIQAPGFADTTTVQVDATMSPDTTKEQFREMLRNLIAERFQLKYHVESREVSGYSLVVAKGGAKLKEVEAPTDPTAPPAARPRERAADGFPVPPKGSLFFFSAIEGHRARITSQQKPITNLVDGLHSILRVPITDETGLHGFYDYTVTYAGGFGADGPIADGVSTAASEPSDLPDIFNALQSQVGLKLEPKKVPVEILVVDHMEKTPSGN